MEVGVKVLHTDPPNTQAHTPEFFQRTKVLASRVVVNKGPWHHLVLIGGVSGPFSFSIFCQVHIASGKSQACADALPLDLQNPEPN